jgi:Flp pilus assembly pilin Flp
LLLLRRLIQDESAQDLIEYGLLAATIGIAGITVVPLIPDLMATAYETWSGDVNDNWIPCDPGGC